jgi:putative transposase
LTKARKVAEYAIRYRTFSSKVVKHIGLKSVISNQILRKFGRDRKTKKVSSVKLVIPNQGIRLDQDSRTISIPCLKYSFQHHLPPFESIRQIEIGEEYVYVSVSVKEEPEFNPDNDRYIGIDLNATSHVAVAADPTTGKVWKLGKTVEHLHNKYKNIRRRLQSKGRYKEVKQIKDRESRIIRNINHHISKKIVDIAQKTKSGIRLERLGDIREKKKRGKDRYRKNLQNTLHSWSSHQLQMFMGYKAKLLGIPVQHIDPHYTSKTCSRCGHMGNKEDKKFECLNPKCRHVDHGDVNAAFNIGKGPIPFCILDQFGIDRDIPKGSTDTPKEATLITPETLEPTEALAR